MKKKVSVKTAKNKNIKIPKKVTKRTTEVNNKSVVIVDTPRNFWGLFPNVKNHNFNSMMQRGNYLQDFIKLVEGMPEEQFQKVFIEPCDLNPRRIWKTINCGCPKGTQCLCVKEKLIRNSSNYFDYLVECKLDKYEVEIQHLRYLIELQKKGTQVPSSYSMDEFLKRSGAPNRQVKVNDIIPSKTSLGVTELVVTDEIPKMSESLISSEDKKLKELFGDSPKEDKLKELFEKYEVKKTDDDSKENSLEKKLEDLFNRGNEVKEKKSVDSSIFNSALQTITNYVNVLEENAPKVVTTEASLPPFWQELKAAREVFDKFDDFYAQKQVEAIAAARRVNLEKEKFLKLPENNDYRTSLHQDIKQYLKAERELKVLKKILKSAYQEFAQTKTAQIDNDYLNTLMSRYVPESASNKFEEIFDHLNPNPEAYERAMNNRPKMLRVPCKPQFIEEGDYATL